MAAGDTRSDAASGEVLDPEVGRLDYVGGVYLYRCEQGHQFTTVDPYPEKCLWPHCTEDTYERIVPMRERPAASSTEEADRG